MLHSFLSLHRGVASLFLVSTQDVSLLSLHRVLHSFLALYYSLLSLHRVFHSLVIAQGVSLSCYCTGCLSHSFLALHRGVLLFLGFTQGVSLFLVIIQDVLHSLVFAQSVLFHCKCLHTGRPSQESRLQAGANRRALRGKDNRTGKGTYRMLQQKLTQLLNIFGRNTLRRKIQLRFCLFCSKFLLKEQTGS